MKLRHHRQTSETVEKFLIRCLVIIKIEVPFLQVLKNAVSQATKSSLIRSDEMDHRELPGTPISELPILINSHDEQPSN